MATKAKPAPAPPEKEEINPDTGLTLRQEAFCREFIIDITSATQAAIRAGYSAKTAAQQASRLLTNVKIKEHLARLQKPAIKKFEITRDRIMQEVAALAFSNIMDFVTVDAETGAAWVDLRKCSREEAAALDSYEVTELPPQQLVIDGQELERDVLKTKIKMRDKWGPLEALMKREGLVKEVIEVNHTGVDLDMNEVARRVAFMLRKASEDTKKKPSA